MKWTAIFAFGWLVGTGVSLLVDAIATPVPVVADDRAEHYETKYMVSIIDNVQLALTLQAVFPELTPEWVGPQFEAYSEELCGELSGNTLSYDCRAMLEAYYARTEATIPRRLRQTLDIERLSSAPPHSVSTRLTALDRHQKGVRTGSVENLCDPKNQ